MLSEYGFINSLLVVCVIELILVIVWLCIGILLSRC